MRRDAITEKPVMATLTSTIDVPLGLPGLTEPIIEPITDAIPAGSRFLLTRPAHGEETSFLCGSCYVS